MREYKFRVWSPANNKMYFSTKRPFNEWWNNEDGHNSALCKRNYTVEELGKLSCTDILENDYTDRVTQWTGLLDKTGREIYEGDILKWDAGWFYQQEIIGYIEWITNGFHFISEKNYCNSKIKWLLGDKTDGKIIGNIFENPDLIK